MRWEYWMAHYVLGFKAQFQSGGWEPRQGLQQAVGSITESMNAAGAEGWEMVEVMPVLDDGKPVAFFAFFKRPVP